MQTALTIIIVLALLSVVTTLGLGLFSMARGGEIASKYGNKLMRLRVGLQFMAVLLIAVAFWISQSL